VSRRTVDALAATLLVVCWSSGFVGSEIGVRQASVETVLAWRTLVSAAVIGAWALLRGDRVRPRAAARQAALGLLVQGVYLGGVFAATGQGVPAGITALIAALQPLAVAGLAAAFLGEPTTRPQRAGLLAAATGVVLIVAADLGGGAAPAWAYLLPVVAVVGLTAGTLLEKRLRPTESVVASLALQSAVAAVLFAAVAAVRGTLAPPATASFWGAMAWMVVLSTIGGYGAYLFVVRRSGATRASTLLLLTPPTTALWTWLLYGETPRALVLPGALVCAAGVVLALRSAARDAGADRTPRDAPAAAAGTDRVPVRPTATAAES
jgi:drug/metabolite transporter (DMT)-like permease